jgi:hypothetical protein
LAKYVVIFIVALWATHVLLSRRQSKNTSTAGKSLHRAVESTFRKVAIAASVLIAALAVILLVKHVTS